MTGLCKYSHALGTPGKGAHSLRVGGIAIVDVLLTAGLAGAVTKLVTGRVTALALMIVFALLIILAVGLHEAFCARTRLNAWIFGRQWPDPGDL
jgi:hypothetical protein